MAKDKLPISGLPIRKTSELLPRVFDTSQNSKFLGGVLDPLVQPGVLQKLSGYVGKRYGKTYRGNDVYLDTDETLRSRYQLEPGVTVENNGAVTDYHDYLDFKNQLKFFNNESDRDDKITSQKSYTWNPPLSWDKFVNYREYYWVPLGPPALPVQGQSQGIISTYTVMLGLNSFILKPDGKTNNPEITLYRGQTYKFKVNAPGEGFFIRKNYDTGSLAYREELPYKKGQYILYDTKFWEALADIPAGGNPADINDNSLLWKSVDITSVSSALNYNNGVTNNGTQNGTLTFTVPFDAPDLLFYQSAVDPNKYGRIVVANIDENTKIDVDFEVIGKSEYTSSNGVVFTNGLVVEFLGSVTPKKYAEDTWLVQGVGNAITLTKFSDLVPPTLTSSDIDVVFDNNGFDIEPFDDAMSYPGTPDYIVIDRSSADLNPWSRYNRWFHRSVLDYSYSFRGQDFTAPENSRAKRPIIEFSSGIQLYKHGSNAKKAVDYIDDYTTDIFSTIEGSTGYNIDGEFLFEGARILVITDSDNLVNNRIYEVKFITFNDTLAGETRKQITLTPADDADSLFGECVLIKRGTANKGKMFYFNGTSWNKSQEKLKVNQPPLFDAFDESGNSFSDTSIYPVSNFAGTTLLEYKVGTSVSDPQLGFSLSYQNIDNIGDILFNWTWGTDTFSYKEGTSVLVKNLSTGYYKSNNPETFYNGWILADNTYSQPIVDSQVIEESTNILTFTTINWFTISDTDSVVINFYLNGTKITNNPYTRVAGTFVFETPFNVNDVVSIKIIANVDPLTGYYQIPTGIEKNPLNAELVSFTYGEAIDHLSTSLEWDTRLIGTIPGSSNLKDLSDYSKHASRFMKHSSISPLAIYLLCNKENNIIKSIEYAKSSYTEFKNIFMQRAMELEYKNNISEFVDSIVNDISKTKTADSPFSDSDMIGSGAYSSINYTVEDVGITTFALSQPFTLTELSKRAVYVYINDSQLLNGYEYNFNPVFGFVTITKQLNEGDFVEIKEYVSTTHNNIPPTPTSQGLYKKYKPMMFVDDTYRNPQTVIQGHDGSITVAYGDFRDDLLLELEYRIYNNIKIEYDVDVFDIDAVLGGYYGNAEYDLSLVDNVIEHEFFKWIQNTNINYAENTYFIEYEPFTYTYSNMTDPTGKVNLPGWWRGVYKWFYDTDRPHRCPWEMLGFSEKPNWWETLYGSAPYTSGNLILWEDIRDGIIRQGTRAGTYDRYKRPTILSHLPVDEEGRLVNPLDSGLAQNFVLLNNHGEFKFGDVAPVEYAWRSSSEWPYAVLATLCLIKPFEFIGSAFDRSKTKVNTLGQTVNKSTGVFSVLADLQVPQSVTNTSAGLVQYLLGYAKYTGFKVSEVQSNIFNLNVKLATRLSGFVDKAQQKYLLDSKNPKSTSSNIYIPAESYDIIYNVSSPIMSLVYSGVIVEKRTNGWVVTGYDTLQPYFNYYSPEVKANDPVITVGGVSENYVLWDTGISFVNGQITMYRNMYYRCLKSHVSVDTFDPSYWAKIPKLPLIGAEEAILRLTFNKSKVKKLSYGTLFSTTQDLIDFLLGYESYLQSVGFVFDNFDTENQVAQNWTMSAREFLFWTRHNWAPGSLITLSPGAQKLSATVPVGVADNLLDGFYNYNVLKADGKPLQPQYIDVKREFENITITPANTTEGLYYVRLYYVLKEHVTVFNDRTVFNDVIYEKTTGYRQERIKTQGFRTTDWFGDYYSPGFLFDNVDINVWAPFTDYKLGDIVSYQQYYWVSQNNQVGVEKFDTTNWSKLDTVPEKQLIPNFEYKINQFEDYYNVSSDGIGDEQRTIARHAIGYQTRDYLQNLVEDPVTQFQLYQGFIREKGTLNSISKVFDKISRSGDNSVDVKEEWAVRVGQFGGISQSTETGITINKADLKLDPQPFLVTTTKNSIYSDRFYRLTAADFTKINGQYSVNINTVSYDAEPTRTAGYVKTTHVDYAVSKRDDILNLSILDLKENNNIWVTFENQSWTVLRYNESPFLIVVGVSTVDSITNTVVVTLNKVHNFVVGDIVGIKNITNLTGFYKITEVTASTFTVSVTSGTQDPEFSTSAINNLYVFTEARFLTYNDIDDQSAALLPSTAKLWVDNNGDNIWEVSQKSNKYSQHSLVVDYHTVDPKNLGYKVLIDAQRNLVCASMPPSGCAYTYDYTSNDLAISQTIYPQYGFEPYGVGSFGMSMAISPDGAWLLVGSPLASEVPSNFVGTYNANANYRSINIVRYQGLLYQAKVDITGTGTSTITDTSKWRQVYNNLAYLYGSGTGVVNQGMVDVYRFYNGQWLPVETILSPNPVVGEMFGSEISIGVDGTNYYLAISAPGSTNGTVYTYSFTGSTWNLMSSEILGTAIGQGYGNGLAMSYTGSVLVISSPSTDTVDIYKKNSSNVYTLSQTISPLTLDVITSGDNFGYAIALDHSASTLVVTSPFDDIEYQDQGTALIFSVDATGQYVYKQTLKSSEKFPNELFGESVEITPNTGTIVIGAQNSSFVNYSNFDRKLNFTTFDEGRTTFSYDNGYSGAVYVYELRGSKYFLTEKLEAPLTKYESFGFSIACTDSLIVSGSPQYRPEKYFVGSVEHLTTSAIGQVRVFEKDPAISSWEILAKKEKTVDLHRLKNITLYDHVKNLKVQDLDYVDSAKLKILNSAEQEISYKTLYDPAVYSIGNGEQSVDPTQTWTSDQVGQLWWDLSKAKWLYYEQGDEAYRASSWNTQAPGSSIDIYEWVETDLLPSEWSALADTNDGIAYGVSGQPLYPNDDVYSVKVLYNVVSGTTTGTRYYYWVKNKAIVPSNNPYRKISATTVASLIKNPSASGNVFLGLMAPDQFISYNLASVMTSDVSEINFQYVTADKPVNPVHNEYLLLTEGSEDSVPTDQLELKWIDSLVGYDLSGNRVPDSNLIPSQKLGISFRPRQSMFNDRLTALKIAVQRINLVLQDQPFCDTVDFTMLNSKDVAPSSLLNLYDLSVPTYEDLLVVGTTRLRKASIQLNIVNGYVDSVDILDAGYGYKVPPNVIVDGDGIGAKVQLTIDTSGRVNSVSILNKGKLYNVAIAVVREFSVLVVNDETDKGFWGIYSWNSEKQIFYRTKSQAYDTTLYWSKTDWWATGFSQSSRVRYEIADTSQAFTVDISIKDLLRVKNFGAGGWAILEKISNNKENFLDNYKIVGRELGTIALSESLYTLNESGIGYDAAKSYDIVVYDLENSIELRNIFAAIKNDIFINDYKVEWNKLFFSSVKYIFSEQPVVDWIFKTSFLNVTHNVGPFEERISYKNDNISYYQDYIEEVKPYRSTIRQFVSRYNTIEPADSATSDFDLPPVYSVTDQKVIPAIDTDYVNSYPWKYWNDNHGYSIVDIKVVDAGAEYINPPTVVIDGIGGASAKAFISNGKVSGIEILNAGHGYTNLPTITLVGGNGNSTKNARAVAILGGSKVRSFNLTMKFDRLSKDGRFSEFSTTETHYAHGNSSTFTLLYPPNNNKSSISVTKNNQTVLDSDYSISLYLQDGNLKGKLIFNQIPTVGDIIVVSYEKNDLLLDSVNRIDKFYNPTSGMLGKELNQLMTGIDFGGVEVQGTTFDVTGGWDALPWFTDTWDSVISSDDFYYAVPGNTISNVVGNGTELTVTFKNLTSLDFNVNDTISIAGVTPSSYNGIYTVVDSSETTVTVLSTVDLLFDKTKGGYISKLPIVKTSTTLPYIPQEDQKINVYMKRIGVDSREIRIDDPYYGTAQATNTNAFLPTLVNSSVERIEVVSGGTYTVIPNVVISDSPMVSNSPYYTATAKASVVAKTATIETTDTGNGYSVGDIVTVLDDAVTLRVQSLNKTFIGNLTQGSNLIFGVTDFRNLVPGTSITGTNIPVGTRIDSIDENAGHVIMTSVAFDFETFAVITYESNTGPIKTLSVVSSNETDNFAPAGSLPLTSTTGTGGYVKLKYKVSSVALVNHGSGYIDVPTVTFSSGSASATATLSNTNVSITVPTPTVNISNIPYSSMVGGDLFVFRKESSDGSVTISDSNIVDTTMTGGTLEAMQGAYITASGISAEEIVVDGGKYLSPEYSSAPEENVPGQVLDSVSIKVFHSTNSGATPLDSIVLISDGVTQVFDLGYFAFSENSSILAYANKQILTAGDDYYIDWVTGLVHLTNALPEGTIVEIIIFGIGGNSILDYQEFVADGTTSLYLTHANYSDTGQVFVSVNGVYAPTGFIDSTGVIDIPNKALIQFGTPPEVANIIKIIVIGKAAGLISDGQGIVRINEQHYTYGTSRDFVLDNFTNLPQSSPQSAVVVEVNGVALKGPDTSYSVYDGTNKEFVLGTDPFESSGSILISNISVFVNNIPQIFIRDWVYDGVTKVLTINNSVSLVTGDIVKIENNVSSKYTIDNNTVTLASDVELTTGDAIKITWFGEYPSMGIVADEFTGGKSSYKLAHSPMSAAYVWVYKNGIRLTQDQDFYISTPRDVVYLTESSEITDTIKIILFGSIIRRDPSAFEIYKDMFNVYHYSRFSKQVSEYAVVILERDLNYYDKEIYIVDAGDLFVPTASTNTPGIIFVNNERIEYLQKTGNVLSQLRRGVQGSPIAELHVAGSRVVNISETETLPYNETQETAHFISDGTTTLIGPLEFVPAVGYRTSWHRDTIPEDFGPCDQIEVFASGIRLRKDPVDVYKESNGPISPEADVALESEFSVDGINPYIRLTTPAPKGSRITIIRKIGKLWYQRGETTASSGKTMFENDTPVINFIAQKTTELPE